MLVGCALASERTCTSRTHGLSFLSVAQRNKGGGGLHARHAIAGGDPRRLAVQLRALREAQLAHAARLVREPLRRHAGLQLHSG